MMYSINARDLLVQQNRYESPLFQMIVSNSLKIKQKINWQPQGSLKSQQEYKKASQSWQLADQYIKQMPKNILNSLNSRDTTVYIDLSKQQDLANTITDVQAKLSESRSQNFNLSRQQANIKQFNRLLERFAWKLKAEHQTETNFKLNFVVLNQYDENQKSIQRFITQMHKQIINSCQQLLKKIQSNQKQMEQIGDQQQQSIIEHKNHQKSVFGYLLSLFSEKQKLAIAKNILPDTKKFIQLAKFTLNMCRVFDQYFQPKKKLGSTLFTMQPEIGDFTYLVHPMLMSIYTYIKSIQESKKKKQEQRSKKRLDAIKDDFQSFFDDRLDQDEKQPFKAVFINLDGYESEFNIQFANYMRDNLMYISFPREDLYKDKKQVQYSKRLLTRILGKIFIGKTKNQDPTNVMKQFKNQDSDKIFYGKNYQDEDYYQSIGKNFSKNQAQCESSQGNDRAYVFPLRPNFFLKYSSANLSESLQIQEFQGFLVNYVLKELLCPIFTDFRPTVVIVSYSGKLNIDQQHIIEIFQELSQISSFKLILFPNLTAHFADIERQKIKNMEMVQNVKQQLRNDFDGFTNTEKICYKQKVNKLYTRNKFQLHQQVVPSFNLLNVVAKFLKIGSGTYNLIPMHQAKSINWKKKNQLAISYFNKLLEKLMEGRNIIQDPDLLNELNKFKQLQIPEQINDEVFLILPKIASQKQKQIKNIFNKPNNNLVPTFYIKLFEKIQQLVFSNQKQGNLICENNYLYREQIELLKDHLKKQINALMSFSNNIQLSEQDITLNLRNFLKQYKQSYFLDISNQKVQEKAFVYIRSNNSKSISNTTNINYQDEYIKIQKALRNETDHGTYKQVTQKLRDKKGLELHTEVRKKINEIQQVNTDVSNLYEITFLQRKSQILIGNQASLLYREDQNNIKKKYKKQHFPVLLMNHLSNGSKQFKSILFWVKLKEEKTAKKTNLVRCNMDRQIKINNEEKIAKFGQFANYITYTDWSFAETSQFMILFWPTQFDFIRANICKIIGKEYSPEILDDIYVSSKQKVQFIKVDTIMAHQVCPRSRVSVCYQGNSLYLFGGFYQKKNNYLNLQTDLTSIDLSNLNEKSKVVVTNLKSQLYSKEIFEYRAQRSMKQNSFIKPRIQYHFYHIQELDPSYKHTEQQKKIIMLGGYGENFLQPSEFYKNYYYQLTFKKVLLMNQQITFNLQSIEKKSIFNKVIPINTTHSIRYVDLLATGKKKVLGKKHKEQKDFSECRLGLGTEVFMRYKYHFSGGELKANLEYMFREEQFYHYKQSYMDIYEIKHKKVQITFQMIKNIKNSIYINRNKSKSIYQIYYKPPQIEESLTIQQFQPSLQNMISMALVNNNFLCSLIHHPLYTLGKYVLYETSCDDLKGDFFVNNEKLLMKKMTILQKISFKMHFLFSKNQKSIFIIHGQRLTKSKQLEQYIMKLEKDKNKSISEKKRQQFFIAPRKQQQQSNYKECTSIFFNVYLNPILWSFQFCCPADANTIELFAQSITAEETKNCQWKTWGHQRLKLTFKLFNKPIPPQKLTFNKAFIYMPHNLQHQTAQFSDFKGTLLKLQICYKKQQYQCKIIIDRQQEIIDIHLTKQVEINEQILKQFEQSLNIIHKTKQKYDEQGFENQK